MYNTENIVEKSAVMANIMNEQGQFPHDGTLMYGI